MPQTDRSTRVSLRHRLVVTAFAIALMSLAAFVVSLYTFVYVSRPSRTSIATRFANDATIKSEVLKAVGEIGVAPLADAHVLCR